MNNRNTYSKLKLIFEKGIPPHDFFKKAWESEPLSNVLNDIDIPFALPFPDEDISFVAKNENNMVIGQCSANKVVKYWNHIDNIDTTKNNSSTEAFVKIHQKAVQDEKRCLKNSNSAIDEAFHSAGIAVLPVYRGKGIGLAMRDKQIEICKQNNARILFCETTNLFSATTVKNKDFIKLAEYPYKDLAIELNKPEIAKLDDAFSVWCKKI